MNFVLRPAMCFPHIAAAALRAKHCGQLGLKPLVPGPEIHGDTTSLPLS